MRKVLFILGELKEEDLDWLVGAGRVRRVDEGTAIIREGRTLDTFFIVLDGEFSVNVAALGGRSVALLGSGEVVGDMSLLDSRPPNATVMASAPSTVFAIPQRSVRDKLAGDSGFAARFYRALCVFLANRLSRTMAMSGREGGASLDEDTQDEDEIAPDQLEKVSLAGARFDWFMRRLREN